MLSPWHRKWISNLNVLGADYKLHKHKMEVFLVPEYLTYFPLRESCSWSSLCVLCIPHFVSCRDHSAVMCDPHHSLQQPQLPEEPSFQPDTHAAWNQVILLWSFSDRITLVQGWTSKQESLAPKPNVESYLWWITQTHSARRQTWPAASPYTYLSSEPDPSYSKEATSQLITH